MRCHEVLESGHLSLGERPVEVVVLLLLLHGPEARRSEVRQAKDRAESLENARPRSHRLVRHLQVFSEGVERGRRAEELREAEDEELEIPEVRDALRDRDLLPDEQIPVLAEPPAGNVSDPKKWGSGTPPDFRRAWNSPGALRSDPAVLGPLVETLVQGTIRGQYLQAHFFRNFEVTTDRRSGVREVDFVA